MKQRGDLPADFVLKVSVTLAAANPATARLLEDLGATSINLPVDLSLAQIAAIRQAHRRARSISTSRAPDDFGGTVRHYETAALVRVAAPDLSEVRAAQFAGSVSRAASTWKATVVALSRERVRRAASAWRFSSATCPDAVRRRHPSAA